MQPGQLLAVAGEVVRHYCLTLSGNGGSSIVDLATGLVIACQYGGRRGDNKRVDAAALWKARPPRARARRRRIPLADGRGCEWNTSGCSTR